MLQVIMLIGLVEMNQRYPQALRGSLIGWINGQRGNS